MSSGIAKGAPTDLVSAPLVWRDLLCACWVVVLACLHSFSVNVLVAIQVFVAEATHTLCHFACFQVTVTTHALAVVRERDDKT